MAVRSTSSKKDTIAVKYHGLVQIGDFVAYRALNRELRQPMVVQEGTILVMFDMRRGEPDTTDPSPGSMVAAPTSIETTRISADPMPSTSNPFDFGNNVAAAVVAAAAAAAAEEGEEELASQYGGGHSKDDNSQP